MTEQGVTEVVVGSLLDRIGKGDTKARGALLDLMGGELFGLCTHVLGDEREAGVALVRAFDVMTRDAGSRQLPPVAWVRAVTRAAAVNIKRKGRSDMMTLPDAPRPVPGGPVTAAAQGLKQLDPARAEALRQVWLAGESYEDLSVYFAVRPAQVRDWLRGALPLLRKEGI